MIEHSLRHTTRPDRRATRRARVRAGAVVAAAGALLAAHAPSGAAAATWSPVRSATKSGQSFSPVAAADASGRFSIGFIRQLGDDGYRAEVRRGALDSRLQGGSLVLDASSTDL